MFRVPGRVRVFTTTSKSTLIDTRDTRREVRAVHTREVNAINRNYRGARSAVDARRIFTMAEPAKGRHCFNNRNPYGRI